MKNRSYEKELLDADNIPFDDILITMRELNVVNTWLGGHSITRKGVDRLISQSGGKTNISIAEIGSGGGDNLSAIHNYLLKRSHAHTLMGVDIKPECIKFARQKEAGPVQWICSDYREAVWPSGKPDILFSSLFCHHFTDEELIGQLRWLKANSNIGFFINDLHRHPVAYHSIRLLTKAFSNSPLVKNDGPLSVKRAFTRKEWVGLFERAGIHNYQISWRWAFRFLICSYNEQ